MAKIFVSMKIKVDEIYRDLKFCDKPAIDFYNVGGTYKMVSLEEEAFIAEHERLHDAFRKQYGM